MRIAAMSLAFVAACASLTPALADDRDNPPRRIVTVGFGAGMNTNQPGNPANHHVIPEIVRVNGPHGGLVLYAPGSAQAEVLYAPAV